MRRTARVWTMVGFAVAGLFAGELLCRNAVFRDAIGRAAGRGELRALVAGNPGDWRVIPTGFYAADVEDDEAEDLTDLVIAENLRLRAAHESASPANVQEERDRLRSQFATEEMYRDALRRSGLSEAVLRKMVAEQLRARSWLEAQLSGSDAVGQSAEIASDQWGQPQRYHAAHIFIAAPEGTDPETQETKQKAIEALADQLAHGADFAQLAAEASEDEATKRRGGDLGFFAAWRMPPEFVAQVAKLQPGEVGEPFRSHLGFHLVRLLETKAAAQLPADVARSEIDAARRREYRRTKVAGLAADLRRARFFTAAR